MDVVVHHPEKPVVLMLGAYEPTVWNLQWSPGTQIRGVLVSGYHRQAVAGLPPEVPIVNSTHGNRGQCWTFYVDENDLEMLNPAARRVFGRTIDRVYFVRNGELEIGSPLPPDVKPMNSPAVSVESFRDAQAPLAGEAGLAEAVATGVLRRATQLDVDQWMAAAEQARKPRQDIPPVEGGHEPPLRKPALHNSYVVLKPFTYPSGLDNMRQVTFLIAKGVPRPTGNPAGSAVFDFNALQCTAPACAARAVKSDK